MRKLYLVMGIVVILALVSSPVFALSKADIIASWATPEPAPTYDDDIPSFGDCSPKPTPYPSLEKAKEQQHYRDVYPVYPGNSGDYFIILSPDHDDTWDDPISCASCENWTPPPGAEPYFMPSPIPTSTPVDALNDYTEGLPRECGGSIKRSVEKLIASYIRQQGGTWYVDTP